MSKQLIKRGDIVVFAQRYLPSEPQINLHNTRGKVHSILEDGEHAMVEFVNKPGILSKVFTEDLERIIPSEYEIIPLENHVSFSEIEEAEDNEFGGMSSAQLIASKLYTQEYDPVEDRSISSLLH